MPSLKLPSSNTLSYKVFVESMNALSSGKGGPERRGTDWSSGPQEIETVPGTQCYC